MRKHPWAMQVYYSYSKTPWYNDAVSGTSSADSYDFQKFPRSESTYYRYVFCSSINEHRILKDNLWIIPLYKNSRKITSFFLKIQESWQASEKQAWQSSLVQLL